MANETSSEKPYATDPKPGPTVPAACRKCGRRWPYLTGLCGYCTAELTAQGKRLNVDVPCECRASIDNTEENE